MHGRRRFEEAFKGGGLLAAYPLDLIRRMYQVEEQARELGAGLDEVKALRQEKTKPILAALWQWMVEKGPGPAKKGTAPVVTNQLQAQVG